MPRTLTTTEVDDFRDRLREAATRIFAEKGFEAFTMRKLAAELSVSPMTPYRYFENKEEILAAVRTHAFERFSDVMEAGFASPGDATERASGAGNAYVRFALDNPQSYQLMFGITQNSAPYPDLTHAIERARTAMTRHIYPLIEAGVLAGDANLIGHVYWASLHGALMLHFAGSLTSDCDVDRLLDASLTAITAGFSAAR